MMDEDTCKNPVLFEDASDPDLIREGDYFYLVCSSFHYSPGLPVYRSSDLVNWNIVAHACPTLSMAKEYDMKGGNRYGKGIWAPSVRKHKGLFYVYFCTPTEGLFVCTAKKMTGPWTGPIPVRRISGWEDPCPYWDEEGNAWLIRSKLGGGSLDYAQDE